MEKKNISQVQTSPYLQKCNVTLIFKKKKNFSKMTCIKKQTFYWT